MTSASNPMITRCPKCGTAFRVTQSQLQSAKGAVRCGSCLNVFKALDYPVARLDNSTSAIKAPAATDNSSAAPPRTLSGQQATTPTSNHANILSAIKPLPVNPTTPVATNHKSAQSKPAASKPTAMKPSIATSATTQKPSVRVMEKSSLDLSDDILISDDMDDHPARADRYDTESFTEVKLTPKSGISLFERKHRDRPEPDHSAQNTDESWAEMLIEDEEDDEPQLGIIKPKTEEQLADEALSDSRAVNTELPGNSSTNTTPGLLFSLVGEKDENTGDDFIVSNEPVSPPKSAETRPIIATDTSLPDASLFETPSDNADRNTRRPLKTQPKMRAYDGSRTSLLMNIIPAPIEFTANSMRRWYQRKLWPSLSVIALAAMTLQIGWFKFDYFSRVEPYRTGYLFLCPYLGCQVPTLVDASQIIASNLIVREHPDTQGALAVDVMIINSAPFEQPFPDLVLEFTNIDEKPVATRRFTPSDYLGGEMVGQTLMPQNQKIHITLDLIDPGAEAVNYKIYIAH